MVEKKEDIVEGIKEESEKKEEEEKKEEGEEEKKDKTLLEYLMELLKEKEASSKPKLLELLE
ncbi:hypothetical protein DRN69_00305 [Candidatus Pacearchaeota archaeon]|nr:MAG: hypothetical protein DRN69_00305 [Candidatus Pacearchaeota archaeon]